MDGAPLVVETLGTQPVARRRIEVVERKGIGHPDTTCDAMVEAISCALNRMCLAEMGAVPHYNVDKVLLIAGVRSASRAARTGYRHPAGDKSGRCDHAG